jgi:hypothetical protein
VLLDVALERFLAISAQHHHRSQQNAVAAGFDGTGGIAH